MHILPAIDLYGKKAVRLLKGDYNNMTVYSDTPETVAADFKNQGASFIHIVDLEGARDGTTPNIDVVKNIIKSSGLFAEVGGGVRSVECIEKYLKAGARRVILGTAAVTDKAFLRDAVSRFGDKIAVGVDVKDSFVAIKGWTENSGVECFDFCREIANIGVKTVICTDISRDGAMRGANIEMYHRLSESFSLNIIASGGVSTLDDVRRLKEMNIYGAIIGKAYYTGAFLLRDAIAEAEEK